jgi:hypothetical protein
MKSEKQRNKTRCQHSDKWYKRLICSKKKEMGDKECLEQQVNVTAAPKVKGT